MTERFFRDPCIACFWAIGSVLVALTILALLVIAIPELGSLPHLVAVAADEGVITSILVTLGSGAVAVAILAVLGTPLAYALARGTSRWHRAVEGIVDLPLVLPHTIAGLMVYLLFMSRGLLGAPAASVGLIFEDAVAGIVVAMVFVSSPYYVNAAREGFESVPVRLENAARTLGASRFQTFVRISLPLAARSLFAGALLSWGRAIGEFAAVIMIAYFPLVVSSFIYQRFSTGGLAEARSVAFIMILICLAIFLGLRYAVGRMGRERLA